MILPDWIPAFAGMTSGHDTHIVLVMSGDPARHRISHRVIAVKEPKKDGRKSRRYLNGADGDRTHDLHVANVALSQLSYCPGQVVSSIRREAGIYSRPERANNNTI